MVKRNQNLIKSFLIIAGRSDIDGQESVARKSPHNQYQALNASLSEKSHKIKDIQ